MLKLIFILVIVLSSAGIGNVIVGEWRDRAEALARLQSAVKTMKGALVYQGMPLCEALMQAAKTAYGSFFARCARLLRQNPAAQGKEICQKALAEEKGSCPFFRGPEKEALADLFLRISTAVSGEQIEDACAVFIRQTDLIVKELRAQQEQKGRLTKTLCTVAGLIVSILLV